MALAKELEVTMVVGDPLPYHDVEVLKQLIRKVAKRKLKKRKSYCYEGSGLTGSADYSNFTTTTQPLI